MKTWTRSQYVTYVILLILLVIDISQSVLVLLYDDLRVQNEQVRHWAILLYGIILFGSFPIIAIVIRLNQDHLHKINIDKFYIALLVCAGLAGLYFLPYNIFSIIALFYLVFVLFSNRAKFGILDNTGFRMILIVVGVYVGILFLRIGLGDAASIDLFQGQKSVRHLFLESIPFATYEEAVFRGILCMFLRDLGMTESKTNYTQAFLFWATHVNLLISSPLFFWVILPVLSLTYGYIAARSKSLAPSSIAHILYNSL
jgi:hypothetical protein